MNLLEKKQIHNTTLSYCVGQNRKWDRRTNFPTNQFTHAGLTVALAIHSLRPAVNYNASIIKSESSQRHWGLLTDASHRIIAASGNPGQPRYCRWSR